MLFSRIRNAKSNIQIKNPRFKDLPLPVVQSIFKSVKFLQEITIFNIQLKKMFVQISRSRIPGKILKLCLIKFGKKTLENTNSKKH